MTERGRGIFQPLAPFPNGFNSKGWTRQKQGAWNTFWVFHLGDRDTKNLDHLLLLSQVH